MSVHAGSDGATAAAPIRWPASVQVEPITAVVTQIQHEVVGPGQLRAEVADPAAVLPTPASAVDPPAWPDPRSKGGVIQRSASRLRNLPNVPSCRLMSVTHSSEIPVDLRLQ